MSLSETARLWSRWRRFAILWLALPAGGCFQPLYGEAAHPGLTEDLRAILVMPINERLGHYLGNDLIADLNGTGVTPEPKYRLTVTTGYGISTPTVTSQLQLANAATLNAFANFTLTPFGGGVAILSGSANAVAVYDRTEQRFTNLRSQRDAEIRVAKSLADEIELRIAAALGEKH